MKNIHKYIKGCSDCNFYSIICKHDIEPSDDEKLSEKEKILYEIERFTEFNNDTSNSVIDNYNLDLKKLNFKICKLKSINEYKFITRCDSYTFSKISDVFDFNDYYNELTSENRYGKCHNRSFMFAIAKENSFILTGYINGSNLHVLHSVVEINAYGKTYICDWTKNLIILKDDYIKLTNFKIISKISHNQLIEDMELINTLNLKECLKIYLLFREELKNEFDVKSKTLYRKI